MLFKPGDRVRIAYDAEMAGQYGTVDHIVDGLYMVAMDNEIHEGRCYAFCENELEMLH